MINNNDIKKYEYLVDRIVWRYTSGKVTPEDREDLKQVGLIALINAYKSYNKNKNDNFFKYASVVIARAIIRASKQISNRINDYSIEVYELDIPSKDTTLEVDNNITSTDMFIKICRAIRRLNISILNKKILTLRVIGLTNTEISERLHIKRKVVEQAVFSHKDKLINKLRGGI